MSVALLDVNVLIALHDPYHPHHEPAHEWFRSAAKLGWASCSLTISGCIRIMSNPRYPSITATPAQVAERLQSMCQTSGHRFWSDDVALTDAHQFDLSQLSKSSHVTDVHLLALAVRNDGYLATFDRSIPLPAVTGAKAQHLKVLGAAGR